MNDQDIQHGLSAHYHDDAPFFGATSDRGIEDARGWDLDDAPARSDHCEMVE